MGTSPLRSDKNHTLTTVEQLYRIFLHLYPRQFRREYGSEMIQTFRDCCREALQRAGFAGLMHFIGYILYELLMTASIEHAKNSILSVRRLFGLEREHFMLDSLFNLNVGYLSDKGVKRPTNEDDTLSIIPTDKQIMEKKGALFVVSDGMGGHARGDVASAITVNTVNSAYYRDTDEDITASLARAVQQANLQVYQEAQNGDEKPMGSTCIAAVVHANTLHVANVGDSRAYIIRDGQAKQISEDHSVVAQMVQEGKITAAEARTHEDRNKIYRSIGNKLDEEVDTFTEPIQSGDLLLLCTDGLWESVEDEEICTIIAQHGPQQSASHLIARANELGGPDNITAVVVAIGS